MLCDRSRDLFSDHIEGTLPEALSITFTNHLGECQECSNLLEDFGRVWNVLEAAPVVEPPANFREIVWAKIEASKRAQAPAKPARAPFTWKSIMRPANLAWAAAGLAFLALMPAVVPGTHSTAKMFPWSLVYRAPAVKQPEITVGPTQVSMHNRKQEILLKVNNPGSEVVRVNVALPNGNAITIDAEAGKSQWYVIAEPTPNGVGNGHVEVAWSLNGTEHKATITMP